MPFPTSRQILLALAVCTLAGLAGCAQKKSFTARGMSEHECMTRVMYFESNRSSEEGMIAVGTVVMNRLNSGRYPTTVCGVVGQKNQFAPGVLTRPMEAGRDLASRMATQVLKGARHRTVGKAMFFHTAGMTFPYTNMHYLIEAGGNVFYEKRKNARRLSDPPFVNPGRTGEGRPGEGKASEGGLSAALPAEAPRPLLRTAALAPAPAQVAFDTPAPTRAAPRPAQALDPIRIEDLIEAGRF